MLNRVWPICGSSVWMEWAGWLGALGSILFFGSYAVPIRMPSALASPLDPVVFQAYKSLACFATSWLVLLYVPLKFTWWGLVGAGIWVMTGIGAIMGVRLAGIGTAQSLWSGLSILVSYIWGAYVFHEPIKSPGLAILALLVMAVGMAGVTLAAAGEWTSFHLSSEQWKALPSSPSNSRGWTGFRSGRHSQFIKGVLCAVFVGLLNGSFLVPLKYANQDVVGVEYLVSFGVGALLLTSLVLGLYSAVLTFLGRPRPGLGLGMGAVPALATGLMWSAGNFCSIYATLGLGLSLGWPLVQCQVLISATWAVFYFHEVQDRRAAGLLLASSAVVIAGVFMLSMFGTNE